METHVGGAAGVGDDLDLGVVGVEVHTADVHGGVSRRGRDDDLLGTALQVSARLLGGGEDTGGLDDVVGALLAPRDGGGVTLSVDGDLAAVDNELAVLGGDLALEDTVGGVVCECGENGNCQSPMIKKIRCEVAGTYT